MRQFTIITADFVPPMYPQYSYRTLVHWPGCAAPILRTTCSLKSATGRERIGAKGVRRWEGGCWIWRGGRGVWQTATYCRGKRGPWETGVPALSYVVTQHSDWWPRRRHLCQCVMTIFVNWRTGYLVTLSADTVIFIAHELHLDFHCEEQRRWWW